MKMYWQGEGIAPCILNFSTRWNWVLSFMSQLHYPQGKSPLYPLEGRLGGFQSCSECSG